MYDYALQAAPKVYSEEDTISELTPVTTINSKELEDFPVELGEDDFATLNLHLTPTPKPKPNPPTPASNSPVPNKSTVPNTNINRTLPKSGDGSSIPPYAWLMLTSGGLLVLIGYRRKKHVK